MNSLEQVVSTRPSYLLALMRPALWAALAFGIALSSGLWVVWLNLNGQEQTQRTEAFSLASAQAALLNQRLDAALSATYALGAVLRQNHYVVDPESFTQLATELMRYHPGISSLQYSPGGITTHIVPIAGNEKAVGNNLLLRNDRNKEALQAVETRRMTLAGPFELRQGGSGVAGRLPIFLNDHVGDPGAFWGFAVALIRIPELIRSANLDSLTRHGYNYGLWRVHPDTGEKQVFVQSGAQQMSRPVEVDFPVPNGRWYLSAAPKNGWLTDQASNAAGSIALAFAFAILVAWMVFFMRRQPVLLAEKVATRTRELDEEIRVRRAAETELKLAAQVFESSAEAIMITDAANLILSVNESFTRMTGYSADEVRGQSPVMIASGRHDPEFFKTLYDTLLKHGHWQGEIWNRRKNGEVFPQWQGVSVVRDEDGKITQYVSISSDITARKASEERINFLSHYDTLTGLPNRTLLQDRVNQAMMVADLYGSKVSLMSLDLDRFKLINDSLGHQMGDRLLIEVVNRLKLIVRSADTISRQGGDEFVIVLQDDSGLTAASKVAQKIQERMATMFEIDGHEIRVTSSIGIAVYPDDAGDLETLLKRCDIAMYHAKESGRATYRFFTPELNIDTSERMVMESELARAVDRQEFVLHYQPQIDLASGRVIAAEALVRWMHPEKGLVPPARFIPVAEETGLIVPLGDWVLCEACRQARAWQDAGHAPMVVSVNLSGVQFRRPGLVARVAEVLSQFGLAAEILELELTESILVQDAQEVLQTLRELKALGVKLAIDDFGTGYSSLSYLKRFDVDKLKIDQSFVRDLCTNPEDAAIVQAVIQLGLGLNLAIIAEGAETAEQVQMLRDKGCQQVQGYFFSRPLPAAEFETFLVNFEVTPGVL